MFDWFTSLPSDSLARFAFYAQFAVALLLVPTFLLTLLAAAFAFRKDQLDSAAEIQASKELATAMGSAGAANERAAKLELKSAELEKQTAELRKQTAEANALAKGFEAQIASAEAASKDAVAKVAIAEARAVEAGAKTEEFRLDIARANERAAEANRIAESERLARVKLEIRLAPRVLTADQQSQLVAALSRYGVVPANVVLWGDTYEIQTIGNLIIECLRKAGWTLGRQAALGGGGTVRGIVIGIRADADVNTRRAGEVLISQLVAFGLVAGAWEFDKMPRPGTSVAVERGPANPPIKIFIGSKP